MVGFYGTLHIPEEKREELGRRILYIAKRAGMARLYKASLFEKDFLLFGELEPEADGKITYRYLYPDDMIWSSVTYDPATGKLSSGEMGSLFAYVTQAVYIMAEMYSDTPCLTHINGKVGEGDFHIGWINYLFSEEHSTERITKLKEIELSGNSLHDSLSDVLLKMLPRYYRLAHVIESGKEVAMNISGDTEEGLREAISALEKYPFSPEAQVTTTEFFDNPLTDDDDRLYFWREGDDDVHLSDELWSWLMELKAEWRDIMQADRELIAPQEVIRRLVYILHDIEKTYYRMPCPEDVFYDFITRPEDRRVQASIILLEHLAERYKEGLPERDEIMRPPLMLMTSRNRRMVKKYLAVLGNPDMRRILFDF